MSDLARRIFEIGIEIDGKVEWLKNLYMRAQGIHWALPTQGEAIITIINLRKQLKESILSKTIPLSAEQNFQIHVTVRAGRENEGVSTVYVGSVFRSFQLYKPDTGIQLKCVTGYFDRHEFVNHVGDENTKLSDIAKWFADDHKLKLSFEIDDKNIKSFSYHDALSEELNALMYLEPKSICYIDHNTKTLVVRYNDKPSKYAVTIPVNAKTGLLHITSTESGIEIEMLYTHAISFNSIINVKSEINPTLNGLYIVNKIEFSITSRDEDFNLKVEGFRIRQ